MNNKFKDLQILYYIIGFICIFLISIFLNRTVLNLSLRYQNEFLFSFMGNISYFFYFWILGFILISCFFWTDKKEYILPLVLSIFFTYWTTNILKNLFMTTRPFITNNLIPYYDISSYSFPSLHISVLTCIVFIIYFKNKIYGHLLSIFLFLTFISRIMLFEHYFSDVVFSLFLGGFISYIFIYLEKKQNVFSKLNRLLGHSLEMRRQIMHMSFGVSIIFLHKIYLINNGFLLFITSIWLMFIILYKYFKIPVLHSLFAIFEREKHIQRFPGRGVLFFLIGSLFALHFFEINIAFASICILAFGDSVSNIIGRFLGNKKIFYNNKKTWEGIIVGIIFASISASYFVGLRNAFIASSIAMIIESIDIEIKNIEIDDNLIIPIVSSITLLLLL